MRGEGWRTFVTGRGEAGLAVRLQMAGDVGSAKHLATYVAGDFTLMPDHVGTQAVFGGKSRCAGLSHTDRQTDQKRQTVS